MTTAAEGEKRPSRLCASPWAEPSAARPLGDVAATLTAAQVAQWRKDGYCVVDGVFPAELVAAERAEAIETYPDMAPVRLTLARTAKPACPPACLPASLSGAGLMPGRCQLMRMWMWRALLFAGRDGAPAAQRKQRLPLRHAGQERHLGANKPVPHRLPPYVAVLLWADLGHRSGQVHPRLLRAVAQLLDTEDIRLSECQVWCKYGDYSAPQPQPADG